MSKSKYLSLDTQEIQSGCILGQVVWLRIHCFQSLVTPSGCSAVRGSIHSAVTTRAPPKSQYLFMELEIGR